VGQRCREGLGLLKEGSLIGRFFGMPMHQGRVGLLDLKIRQFFHPIENKVNKFSGFRHPRLKFVEISSLLLVTCTRANPS